MGLHPDLMYPSGLPLERAQGGQRCTYAALASPATYRPATCWPAICRPATCRLLAWWPAALR